MRKKAARLTCAVARYMQPFGGFQYGQMAPADDAAEQSGGGEGGEMRPFSPARALTLSPLGGAAPVIRVGSRRFVSRHHSVHCILHHLSQRKPPPSVLPHSTLALK